MGLLYITLAVEFANQILVVLPAESSDTLKEYMHTFVPFISFILIFSLFKSGNRTKQYKCPTLTNRAILRSKYWKAYCMTVEKSDHKHCVKTCFAT